MPWIKKASKLMSLMQSALEKTPTSGNISCGYFFLKRVATIWILKVPVILLWTNLHHKRVASILESPSDFRVRVQIWGLASLRSSKPICYWTDLWFDFTTNDSTVRRHYNLTTIEKFLLRTRRNSVYVAVKWTANKYVGQKNILDVGTGGSLYLWMPKGCFYLHRRGQG